MLYNLAQYINTDYCLVVQNDGWVLNGNNWRDEFWDYDYIGAPVLLDFKVKQNHIGQYSLFHNKETKWLAETDIQILNGGFSLRSKRLLELPRKLGLVVPIQPTAIADPNELYHIKWDCIPSHNEDLFLSVLMRETLQQVGIRFAPFNVASHFAFENLLYKETLSFEPIIGCLGHHFFEKFELQSFNKVVAKVPEELLKNNVAMDVIVRPFIERGYNVLINKK